MLFLDILVQAVSDPKLAKRKIWSAPDAKQKVAAAVACFTMPPPKVFAHASLLLAWKRCPLPGTANWS